MSKCRRCSLPAKPRNLCGDCYEKSVRKRLLLKCISVKRKGYKYNAWSASVKERDGYKCQHCGIEDRIKLQSHHIIPWEDDIELRFEISNGLTLCRVCHTKEDRRIKPIKVWSVGVKFTEEHKKKLSEAKKGKDPWNKGKKGVQISWRKGLVGSKWSIDSETGKRVWTHQR